MRARVRPAEAGQAHRRQYHQEYYDRTRLRRRELAAERKDVRRETRQVRTAWRRLLRHLSAYNLEFIDHGDPTDS